MIFFRSHRRHGIKPVTRLDAWLIGVIIAGLGVVAGSLRKYIRGDVLASSSSARLVWTLAGGAIVVITTVVLLVLRWKRDQEDG